MAGSKRVATVGNDVVVGSDADMDSSRFDIMMKLMKVYKRTIACVFEVSLIGSCPYIYS